MFYNISQKLTILYYIINRFRCIYIYEKREVVSLPLVCDVRKVIDPSLLAVLLVVEMPELV